MPNDKEFVLCPDCKHDHCVLDEIIYAISEPVSSAVIRLERIGGSNRVEVSADLQNAGQDDPVRKLYRVAMKAIMNINQGADEDVLSEKDSVVGGEGDPSNLGIS